VGDDTAPVAPLVGSETAESRLILEDDFAIPRPRGRVVGSSQEGFARLGTDIEHRLAVQDGALRISPLRTPGWGRCSLAYGPFRPDPGLTCCVHVLNGHHASETYGIRSMRSQLLSWLRGSHTRGLGRRVPELLADRRRMGVHRRLTEWVQHWLRPPEQLLNDNLAVGFFSNAAPGSADELAAAFLVRGTGVGNGELTARVAGRQLPVAERLTNIPLHLVVVVRDDAVAYYAASLNGAHGAAPHPMMRPLAIADGRPDTPLYLGIEQNVLGEIGFSVDTRVYGARVAHVPALAPWPGTAHAADRLRGSGPLDRSELGHRWHVRGSAVARSATGLRYAGSDTVALLDPGEASGLLRVRLCEAGAPTPWLVWRASVSGEHYRLELTDESARLVHRVDGRDDLVATGLADPCGRVVEITDDGTTIRASIDGVVVLVAPAVTPPGPGATQVGLLAPAPGDYAVADFEAHPLDVPMPGVLRLPAAPWRSGARRVVHDDFDLERADLDGHPATTGTWKRRSGRGRFELDGHGLVVAEAPDRTVYTVPWPHPRLADVVTRIVPTREGKRRSRAGVVFRQDDDNFVIVNLWFNDRADGAASVSSFFRVDGREEVYDAVWVNVGDRVQWDRAVDLRVVFDGTLYHAALDGEPVLWRSLRDVYPRARPMAIHEVGLVANWEWGLDTGSRFLAFDASTGDPSVGNCQRVQHE
jgi:hypothetical protein